MVMVFYFNVLNLKRPHGGVYVCICIVMGSIYSRSTCIRRNMLQTATSEAFVNGRISCSVPNYKTVVVSIQCCKQNLSKNPAILVNYISLFEIWLAHIGVHC